MLELNWKKYFLSIKYIVVKHNLSMCNVYMKLNFKKEKSEIALERK